MFGEFFFYAGPFEVGLFPLSVGVAGSDQHHVIWDWFALEFLVDYHFFNVAEFISGIELIKKDPYLLPGDDFDDFGSREDLLVEIVDFLLVNSGVNVENEESVTVDDFHQKLDEGCFAYAGLAHDDDWDVRDCPLDNQAHFEEVIESDTVVLNVLPDFLEILYRSTVAYVENIIS